MSIITLISLLGVSFGVMVLIVVLSIHNGFERNLKDTLLGHSPHISIQSSYGTISNWEEMEVSLAKQDEVESAFALVEGFVLLDSRAWQRPSYFRAFNTENEGQIRALEKMLDRDNFPDSTVDFNPAQGASAGTAPDLAPDSAQQSGEIDAPTLTPVDGANFAPGDTGELYGNRYVVVSSELAKSIGLKVGDEIRIIAASNLDEVMAVYNVPKQRVWELHPDIFEDFEGRLKKIFETSGGEEKALSLEVTNAYQIFQQLLPMVVSTPNGDVETEGVEMRPAEREIVRDILDRLDFVDRREGGHDYFEAGTRDLILGGLKELRELDLEKADNEAFRKIEKFVVPKELKIQGIYSDSERSKGPDLFIPITIGMELKGLRGEVETIGLRIEDPYKAEEFAINLQKKLGNDWIVRSWMKTHAERFQLVKTEKIMMSFALSFITLLSAFSIMAVMYTVTVQKRQEIGVMKALGARPSQIVRVFVYQGLIVGIGGAIFGLGLGLLAIRYREGIMAIIRGFGIDPFPPEFHGMSELPAEIMGSQLWVICVVAVILCLFAALVPALMAAFRDPAKSLRNL
ncbi:MAG: FtsX-like permease family protein [Akkermansiaceae bacterium]|nr:FtsX-like permease family protein [Akkermansiaceae bacterium]